jgi:hypothetical protein
MKALLVLAALGVTIAPAAAQRHRAPLGTETVINNAANGGIRNFQPGPSGSSTIYLQDRRLLWYRVDLSGPCFPERSLNQVGFRTGPDNRLDRLSSIYSLRFAKRVCGVRSITASAPPAGQPGGPKPSR